MIFNKKDYDSKQRFGIRKLSVGACSVLLSTLFLVAGLEEQPQEVHAATDDEVAEAAHTGSTDTDNPQNHIDVSDAKNTVETDSSTKTQDKEQSVTSNAPQTDKSIADESSIDESSIKEEKSEGVSVEKAGQEQKPKEQEEDQSAQKQVIEPVKNNTVVKTDEDTSKKNDQGSTTPTQSTDQAEVEQKDSSDKTVTTVKADTATIDNTAEEPAKAASELDKTATTETVDIDKLKSDLIKNKSLKLTENEAKMLMTSLAATDDTSEINQIIANATQTIKSDDGRFILYISRNEWGNTTNGDQEIKILFNGTVKKGDKVSISIPNYGIIDTPAPTIDSNYGNATVTKVGDNNVITLNFFTKATMDPIIRIPVQNGYGAVPGPMKITTPTTKEITWKVNNVQQKNSGHLLINVNPVWSPTFKRIAPDPNPKFKSDNTIVNVIPGNTVIYELDVNETNGLAPGKDGDTSLPYASKRVNSAVNYGTTITIPMPKGFKLDEQKTQELNVFSDKTTITQLDNGTVVISVPEGSGSQGHDNSAGYKIVGKYNIAEQDKDFKEKAIADITIKQYLDSNKTEKAPANLGKYTETFYGKNNIPAGEVNFSGMTAYNDTKTIMNNGKKQIVSYFAISNSAASSFDKSNSTITLTFDNGLGVTEIKTPTITGTKNYDYTITYDDGSTATGNVVAGKFIVGSKNIAKVEIKPDYFEQYQGTDSTPSNSFSDQTQEDVNAFEAYGAVASTVAEGTKLESSLSFSGSVTLNGVFHKVDGSTTITQTVVQPVEDTSKFDIYSDKQTVTGTGSQNAADISLYKGTGSTKEVYEPTFYYVLPEYFSVNGFSTDYTKLPNFWPNSNNGVEGHPKLTLFTVPTDTKGVSRQVVKIDYSGTGYTFYNQNNANNMIRMDILADGINGTYQGMIYVVSPKTKLTNTAYNSKDTSNFAPSGISFNAEWVQGNTNNLYYVGSADYSINQSGGANTVSLAGGNKGEGLVDNATADVYGENNLSYAVRLVNESGTPLTNVEALINLPQATDNNGTSFTFQLNGRPSFDTGKDSNYTFWYSTNTEDLLSETSSSGSKLDSTNFVTGDEVKNWSAIKSIIIKTNKLNNDAASARFVFEGHDPDFKNDARKIGYISTGFYSDAHTPFVSKNSSSITIGGTATLNYKFQYTDDKGTHNVDLPNVSTSYDLSKKNNVTEQTVLNFANKNQDVLAKLPAGYQIDTATLEKGDLGGNPQFGTADYYYNGATVVLHARLITTEVENKTVKRNIYITGLPNIDSQKIYTSQDTNIARTKLVDKATGQVVGYVDPKDSNKTLSVNDGDKAWKATKAWDSWGDIFGIAGKYVKDYTYSVKLGSTTGSDYPTSSYDNRISAINSAWPTSPNDINVYVVFTPKNKKSVNYQLSGSSQTNYTGSAVPMPIDALKKAITSSNTVTGSPLVVPDTLTESDFTWCDNNGNPLTSTPINTATYKIKLNESGINKIANANTAYTLTLGTNVFTYTVQAAEASAALSGSNKKTYDGQVVDTDAVNSKSGNIKVTVTVKGVGENGKDASFDYTLQKGDYSWNTADGSAPKNARDDAYQISLNKDAILQHLQAAIASQNSAWVGNVSITDADLTGNASYTINPKEATVTQSGQGGKKSDGSSAKVDLKTLLDKLSGDGINKDGLTLDDFDWDTPDKKAPTKVGNYRITLNDNGLKKLRDDNPNFNITFNGFFTYTIKPATEKIEYVDASGNVIKTIGNVGSDTSNYGDTADFNVESNVPTNYKLSDGATKVVTIKNGVTQINVELNQPVQPSGPNTPTTPPTTPPEPKQPTKPGQPTQTSQPSEPGKKPEKPAKPTQPAKPSKPNKKKPTKPNKPNKKKGKSDTTSTKPTAKISPKKTNKKSQQYNENTSVKGTDLDRLRRRRAKNYRETVGVLGTDAYRGPKSGPAADSMNYSPQGEDSISGGANSKNGKNGKGQLPQTGSRENLFASILGALSAGLGLFGLSDRRKKKDKD